MKLIIDTEAIRYSFVSADGTFPDYEKLIPAEGKTSVHFDTLEAIKAVSSLKVLAASKAYPIDLTTNDGMVILSSPDDKGQAVIPADVEGEPNRVRIDGKYLADALRACNGMVDLKLSDSRSPVLFQVDGYQLVTMPMLTSDKPSQAEPAPAENTEATEAVAEAEAVVKVEKPKRNRKREKVAV